MRKQKSISGKQLGSTYRRSKAKHKTKEKAIIDVLAKNVNERESNLLFEDTDTHFIFRGKTKFE